MHYMPVALTKSAVGVQNIETIRDTYEVNWAHLREYQKYRPVQ